MSKVDYEKYPAIISEYKGVTFRSKLEKKWAMMFDYLGWKWQYEPFEIDKYTPDFLVKINNREEWVVEVKPIINPNEKYQKRLLNITKKTSYTGCILLYSDIFNIEYPFYFLVPHSLKSYIRLEVANYNEKNNMLKYISNTLKIGIMYNIEDDIEWSDCLLGFNTYNKPDYIIKNHNYGEEFFCYVDNEFLPTDNNNNALIYWKSLNKKL